MVLSERRDGIKSVTPAERLSQTRGGSLALRPFRPRNFAGKRLFEAGTGATRLLPRLQQLAARPGHAQPDPRLEWARSGRFGTTRSEYEHFSLTCRVPSGISAQMSRPPCGTPSKSRSALGIVVRPVVARFDSSALMQAVWLLGGNLPGAKRQVSRALARTSG